MTKGTGISSDALPKGAKHPVSGRTVYTDEDLKAHSDAINAGLPSHMVASVHRVTRGFIRVTVALRGSGDSASEDTP